MSGWEGYSLDTVRHEVNITEDGKTVSVESVNEIFKGSLSILKQDKHTLEPLAGAIFQVMNENGFIVAEATTGEDGIVSFENLVYGSYAYKESKAPDGYSLMADSIYEGTLPVESAGAMLYDISATVRDGIITDLPMTGGNGFNLLLLAVFFAVLGLCSLTFLRKNSF